MPCKKCGNQETLPGRRTCHACRLAEIRAIYANGGKERRQANRKRSTCIKCGTEIVLKRDDQTLCKECGKTFSTSSGNVTNLYARANGGGYCFKHRKVAEQLLHRKLTYNEVVHHLDEDPLNFDVINLVVISRSDHVKLHKFLQKQRVLLEKSGSENLENCWDTLRAQLTTAWFEKTSAKVIKLAEIGQSAAEPLASGEGSETMHQGSGTDNAVDHDIVQTTTEMASES